MKKWLIVSACLMAVGLIVFAVCLCTVGFDFASLGEQDMVTNTYLPEGDFSNIQLDTLNADIVFAPSEDGQVKVVCYEDENLPHHVEIAKDTLRITCKDQRKWYDYFRIRWVRNTITVYLPKERYEDLQIHCTTGDITVPDVFLFRNADVTITTGDVKWCAPVERNLTVGCTSGDVKIGDITCGTLTVNGMTGDIQIQRTQAFEKLLVDHTTGDVCLDLVDAGEITIKTTTGDIFCKLLTEKYFVANTTTGNVNVPVTGGGSQCCLQTTTGDITAIIADN